MLNNCNLQIKPYRESDMIYALRKFPNTHLWSGYFLRSVWKIEQHAILNPLEIPLGEKGKGIQMSNMN